MKVNKILSKFDKYLLTFVFFGDILVKNRRRWIMKDGLTKFTKIILDFMYFAGIIVTATLPVSIKFLGNYIPFYVTYYYQQLILFFIAGILAVLIIGELRKMFASVLLDDCFIRGNVISLRKMGTYSFLISLVCLIRAFIYFTLAISVLILVFIIAGLFSKVLSSVFDKAVTYKMENDLTI